LHYQAIDGLAFLGQDLDIIKRTKEDFEAKSTRSTVIKKKNQENGNFKFKYRTYLSIYPRQG